MNAPGEETRSTFESTTGGVMTAEAGAITGELEVATRLEQDTLETRVRYVGAEEWYTVEGSPVALEGDVSPSPSVLHDSLVEHLRRPGQIVSGNEQPASLRGFSSVPDDA